MILEIVADLGYLVLFINTLLFLKSFSSKGKAHKIFGIYLLCMFLIQISAKAMHFFKLNNLMLSHFYFIAQFILLSCFYLNLRMDAFQTKTIKVGFAFCLGVLGMQYLLDATAFLKFNLFEIFITSFLLIIYSTFYLYNLLNEKKEFYYINLGILIYLFGSTVIFLAGNLTTIYKLRFVFNIWILNAFLYLIYQLLILFEWRKNYSNQLKLKNG
ncbi:hypothetical protein LZZ90_13720 [Flavobacterium sp. SM15]|uniref:hypothetical protein n=1 Tax=Flavobacterium sp. SM15 TaxID=2908005 RepID=UPI001EDC4709|nr:hypothetical protein [Flavobacterium sp. SM15]MCG2612568.1 hypothetical protein [Flavobacterium sp. SM15]